VLEAVDDKQKRRSPWLSRRTWRRRLVFWGGALVVGTISVLFTKAANWAQAVFLHGSEHFWGLPLLLTPAGFVLCAWMAREFFPGSQGSGIPQAIAARHFAQSVDRYRLLSVRIVLGKILLTIIGLLCGASVGREGPTVQVGAAFMLQVAKWRGLQHERGLILAGSAAGIAAAFNTPLAGIVFAIEEMSRSFEARTSGLVLYAVIISGLVSLALVGNYTYFGTTSVAVTTALDWGLVLACGVVGGLAGGAFARLMLAGTKRAQAWAARQSRARKLLLPLACGVVVALLGMATHGATFGTGYAQAHSAVEGHALAWYVWPAKFIANLATAISGIPGGIFAPSLAVGAGLGDWLAGFGMKAVSLGAVLGMAGYFAGVVQAPITAFVIILEMTDNDVNVIPLMVAAVLGYGASKLVMKQPLYHALSQGFMPPEKEQAKSLVKLGRAGFTVTGPE
jgi:H+/Cl- antiporter ClcA